ncbi:phage tail tape measure protein, TP901 family, core region [Flexibacter flexilis DSM 6793]|uniref:Phage tail tape measure protein, TP901 family, core region n=1 Tax=Flexibacter flexilis DSM 6793 TaxID=927664 RepID=A0A1I1E4N4_9BACT|nr:phage tail tape measure protein [Flexibacter flexilis]SFB80178.1 phage tail tape measure protein, TP901 family, core region [Flexibacter flexilis DSM 6793]
MVAEFILRLVDQVTKPLGGVTAGLAGAEKASNSFGSALEKAAGKAFLFNQMRDAITSTAGALDSMTAPGVAFQSQLAELSGMTGQTGAGLDNIGQKARETALKFGGDASRAVESYTSILSQLGPQIAQNDVALQAMGENVQILSLNMKGDAIGATDALNTALLQFGADLNNPTQAAKTMTEYMNIMAAATNAGSADVTAISASLKVAGSEAYNANVSFIETNAAIQALGTKSKFGAEAGTALRNVIATMGKGRFLPKDTQESLIAAGVNIDKLSNKALPFTERLKELTKIQKDSALVTHFFGTENSAAATTLLSTIQYQEDLQKQITGTNQAVVTANANLNTHEGRMARINAQFKDWGISIFNATSGMLPFVQVGSSSLLFLSQFAPAMAAANTMVDFAKAKYATAAVSVKAFALSTWTSGLNALKAGGQYVLTALTGIGSYVASLITATAAQWGLNIAMNANPLGLVVLGIVAVVGALALLYTYWDEIWGFIKNFTVWVIKLSPFGILWQVVDYLFPSLKTWASDVFGGIIDWFGKLWGKIVEVWQNVKGLFSNPVTIAAPVIENPATGTSAPVAVGVAGQLLTPQALTAYPTGIQNPIAKPEVDANAKKIDTKAPKKTEVGGDTKARIVNLRIDKIEVSNHVSSTITQGLDDLENKIARVVVAALNDAEIIMSNG